jgi:hypothetical protein
MIRYMIKMDKIIDAGNMAISDPKIGGKIHIMLKELKAEAVYFKTVDGHRGGYIIINTENAYQIPAMIEPLYRWFKAHVELIPVMLPQDFARAEYAIGSAVGKWG